MGLNMKPLVCLMSVLGAVSAGPKDDKEENSGLSPTHSSTALSFSNSTSPLSNPTSSLSNSTSLNLTQSANATTTLAIEGSTSTGTATTSADLAAVSDEAKTCHQQDSKPSPFCKPVEGQKVTAGQNLTIIWDAKFFESNSNCILNFNYSNSEVNNSTFHSFLIPRKRPYALITVDEKWFKGNDSSNFTISIFSIFSHGNSSGPHLTLGPTLTLSSNSTVSSPPQPTNKSTRVGVKVGIPIGLAIFVAGLLIICFAMKKQRRSTVAGITGARKDYLTGRSRSQRVPRDGIHLQENEMGVAGGGVGNNRFRDEPERGLELQDQPRRTPSSAGSSISSLGSISPTSEGFGSQPVQGGGGRNVFRDEIVRQRGGDHDAWR